MWQQSGNGLTNEQYHLTLTRNFTLRFVTDSNVAASGFAMCVQPGTQGIFLHNKTETC